MAEGPEVELDEMPTQPEYAIPGFFVAMIDGQVEVTPQNLPLVAAPTLLRLGAALVEEKLGL